MSSISREELGALLEWSGRLDIELKALRAQRDELDELIAKKETQARNLRELLTSEGCVAESTSDRNPMSDSSIIDAAYDLVSKGEQPMHYRELADRLGDNGVLIPGRVPHANLLSYLVRDERFQRTGRGTYALAEWRLKPMNSKKSPGTAKRSRRTQQ